MSAKSKTTTRTQIEHLPVEALIPYARNSRTHSDEGAEDVDAAIAKAKEMGHGESGVNENSNGNALAFICQSFNRANP